MFEIDELVWCGLMSTVSLVDCNKQDTSMQQAIEESLNLIDFQFSKDIKKVVIKPNMCYYWDYSTGETTDPRFVGAIIDVIRSKLSPDVEISLIESDASAMKCKYAFRILGYEKLAEAKNVKLINVTDDPAETVSTTVGNETYPFSIPKTIQEADLLINVPKIKYMSHVTISCALKNMYGCNPFIKKYKYHKQLAETIVGINKVMKPHLTIVDGIRVKGVRTLKLGMVMSSTDPVAIDAAASQIAGLDPKSLDFLKLASQEGIGSTNFVQKGTPLNHFKALFPGKTMKYKTRDFVAKIYVQHLARK